MILDLHTHTQKSHDGFTTPSELLVACRVKGLDAVAITEHDRLCDIDPEPFIDNGIELIPGCEFTDQSGAHILGLFVQKALPFGSETESILDHIHAEDGIAVMPHPWKPGSGFMHLEGDSRLVARFDFIEALNGGWLSHDKTQCIVRLATDFGIRMIASSDSHKACQIGLCCTRIAGVDAVVGARQALADTAQSGIDLIIDRALLAKHGRRSNAVQRAAPYQAILPLVPDPLKRVIKKIGYSVGSERHIHNPNFERVDLRTFTW